MRLAGLGTAPTPTHHPLEKVRDRCKRLSESAAPGVAKGELEPYSAATLTQLQNRQKRPFDHLLTGLLLVALLGLAYSLSRPTPSLRGSVVEPFSLPLIANSGSKTLTVPGNDVLVLEFFASWCRACRSELPRAEARGREANVAFVSVSLDDGAAAAGSAASAWRLTSPVAFDEAGTARRAFDIQTLPTMVIVSPQGEVTGWFRGSPSQADFTEAIARARGM